MKAHARREHPPRAASDRPSARTEAARHLGRERIREACISGLLWALGLLAGLATAYVGGVGPHEIAVLDRIRRIGHAIEQAAGAGGLLAHLDLHEIGAALATPSVGVLTGVLGGYGLAVGEGRNVGDLLVFARAGSVLIGAAAVPLVDWVARPALGRRGALLAAMVLLASPRFLQELGMAGSDAVRATAWLLALGGYLTAACRGSSGRGALRAGTLFTVALLIDESVGAAIVVMVAHFMLCRARSFVAELRAGRLALPTAAVAMVVFGAGAFCWVWSKLSAQALAFDGPVIERLTTALVLPTTYRGVTVVAPPVPADFAARWLFGAVPSAILGFAVVGFAAWARARGGEVHERARERDRDVGALAALVIAYFCLVAPFAPTPFLRFPVPAGAALPWVAIAAAHGLLVSERVGAGLLGQWGGFRRLAGIGWGSAGKRLVEMLPFAVALGPGAIAVARGPATLAAYVSAWAGGTAQAAACGFPPAGSAMASLAARSIDLLGRARVSAYAPGVPTPLWETLHAFGRLRTEIRVLATAQGADLAILVPRSAATCEGLGATGGTGATGATVAEGATKPPQYADSSDLKPPVSGARTIERLERSGRPVLAVYELTERAPYRR